MVAIACGDLERFPSPPNTGSGGSSSGGPIFPPPPGPCTEGDTRDCHVVLGQQGSVLSCYDGTQVCTAGEWGNCLDGTVSVKPAPPAAPQPLLFADAGACSNNPCDPTCQVFDDGPDGGLSIPQSDGGSFVGGSLSSLPSGFENKALKDINHPPKFDACSSSGYCQLDHYCKLPEGACVPWGPGEFDSNCGDPNYTLGVPCDGYLPVCNRGGTTAPAGAKIVVMSGNSAQLQDNLGKCTGFSGTVAGTCTVDDAIPPGQCVNAVNCLSLLTGTRSIAINSTDYAPPHFNECDCADNWAVYSNQAGNVACQSSTSFETLVFKEVYIASCPVEGTKAQWGLLTYEATTPSNASGQSSITIQAHTAQPPATIDATCADCVTLATVPASDPTSCTLAGPAPCPKDLYSLLGLPSANNDVIELVFTLNPTPDGQLAPTLLDWQLTYSCPYFE